MTDEQYEEIMDKLDELAEAINELAGRKAERFYVPPNRRAENETADEKKMQQMWKD